MNLRIFGIRLLACKFNGLFHSPNFDPIALAKCDYVFELAELFHAGLIPDLSPICNFVNAKILLFVANDKVLSVKWVEVLVVSTWRNLLLPNRFRFPELLTADISDIATYPVPFVLRDDKPEPAVGIRFDRVTSLWFVEAKDKDRGGVVFLGRLHQDLIVV